MDKFKSQIRNQKPIGDEVFDRILQNKPYDRNLRPYDEKFLNKILSYFEDREDYEKCQIISNFIKNRFDHNKNYLNKL